MRFSSYGEALGIFSEPFWWIIVAWSNSALVLFWHNVWSLTLTHFIWYNFIFCLSIKLFILSRSWYVVVVLLYWFSLHCKTLSIFAKSLWWRIVSWSRLISGFFRNNVLSLALIYFIWNNVILCLTVILVIFSGSWYVILSLVLRFSSNSETFWVFSKSFWRIIITRPNFVLFFFWNDVLSLTRAHFVWHNSIFGLTLIVIIFTWSRYIILSLILSFSSNGEAFWVFSKSFWRIIISWAYFVLFFSRDNILSLTRTHFVWNHSIFSLTLIVIVFSWSWYIVVILFNWLSLHGKTLTILTKSLLGSIVSWSWLISGFFRNNVLSLTLTNFISNNIVFSLAVILIILSRSRHIVLSLILSFSGNSETFWVFSKPFWGIIITRPNFALFFFWNDVLSLTRAHFVWDNSISSLTLVIIVFSRSWHIVIILFNLLSLHGKALTIFTKSLWRSIISRSRLISGFFGNNVLPLTRANFIWNYSIFSLAMILIILSWSWNVILSLILSFSSYSETFRVFSESFWWIIITRSNFALFLFWNNILSLARTHFIWHNSIFSLTLVIIIFAWSRHIILSLILRFSSNSKAFRVFPKSFWWIIIPRSNFTLLFFWDYILSLTCAHFVRYYSIFCLVLVIVIFTWPWHVVISLFALLSLNCEALSFFTKSFWRWIISWSWLTSSFFRYNILSLAWTHLVWNNIVSCLTKTGLIFSWSWNSICVLLLRLSLNSKL